MGTIGDAANSGAQIALTIFGLVIALLIISAGTIDVAVERFARFAYAVSMTFAPTSPVAVYISLFSVVVGAISASRFKDSVVMMVAGFVAVYTLLGLSLNYLTATV